MDSAYSSLEPARTGTTTNYTPKFVIILKSQAHVELASGRDRRATTTDTDTVQEVSGRLRVAQEGTMDLEANFFEDYGRELEKSSRSAFECFMEYNAVAQPMLAADPNGIVEATWARGEEVLSVRFKDRYRLSFAISYLRDGIRLRQWAESSLATFFTDCPEGRRLAAI